MKNDTVLKPGRLFAISAPSGAGKTTLSKYLRQQLPELKYSVSHTTRPERPDEVEGRDYYFIGVDEFERMTAANQWLEWACVHGNYYGTSLSHIKKELAAGHNILLEIDVQGVAQVLDKGLACTTIFIMPPDMETLRQRLRRRGGDSPQNVELRMRNALAEIAHKDMYQYIIVNDNLEKAQNELYKLVAGVMYG